MSRRFPLTLIAVATAVTLAGCQGPEIQPAETATVGAPVERTISIRAEYDEEGVLRIDQEFHETAELFPGDKLSWLCECPDDTEFKVSRIRYLADLDAVADLYHELHQEMVRAAEAAEPAAKDPAAMDRQEMAAACAETRDELAAFREKVRKPARTDPGPPLEVGPPAEFTPAGEPIRGGPYRKIKGNHSWKFEWTVRKVGSDDAAHTDVWDPHFSGHGRRG